MKAFGSVAVSRRTSRPRFTLILLVLSSVTLLTLDVRGFAPLEWVRSGALAVFAPVGGAAAGVLRPAGDAWGGAFQGAELQRENDDLRRRLEELQGQMAQGRAAQAELDQLKRSLDLPFAGAVARVTGRVTSGAIADFDDTVEIDKGSDDGIAKGMPVVVDSGLVGTVATVAGGRAVVRLVTDRSVKVGVNVPGGAARGLVQGRGDAEVLGAGDFDADVELPDGALLLTAGTPGSLFPPGIPVGTVQNVTTDDASRQKRADVRLGARLDDLAFVTVLLYRAPS
jgi:rod shape-determining protein MreC